MESGTRIESYVRRGGIAAGIALVVLVVLAFRIPDGKGTLGADVIVAISPTGELGVSRPGPFMSATGLRPGGTLSGDVEVANQTGRRLAVRLRALPDSEDLDRLHGRLGGLRTKTAAFLLDSGRKRTLRVRASLPAAVRDGYAGRIETISLELSSTVEAERG